MPLLKLWNSLRGRSTNAQTLESVETENADPSLKSKPSIRVATGSKSAARATFGLFGGGTSGTLRKRLKSISANSVLEIGVDDGARAIAVMDAVSKTSPATRYVAIDEFEMAGGVNLKQFHQTLRNHGIRPQMFPGCVERGLMQVAHTIGAIDLILISNPDAVDSNPVAIGLLERISHCGTTILALEDDAWNPRQVSSSDATRRAA